MSECLLDLEEKIIQLSHRFTPQNTEIFWKKEDIGPKVRFQFIAVLPTLTIESSRGYKYQNPSDCLWDIDKRDANDFEERGLGKIIQ
jgi:hypothetical protein